MAEKKRQPQVTGTKVIGLLAQFPTPDALVEACDEARRLGYKKFDAHSPFPVHGIDDAIGIRRTKLPFIVLAVGLTGLMLGLGMQIYTNASEELFPFFSGYKFLISQKPFVSLPAFIPVTFEVIVLSSAFAAFFGMWALNRLPQLYNPLFAIERFRKATDDRFFLSIQRDDPLFDEARTRGQMESWHAEHVDVIQADVSPVQLPVFFRLAAVLIASLMLIPPAMIYKARGEKNTEPRLHFNPDMDRQFRYQAQTVSPVVGNIGGEDVLLFGDMRSTRVPVSGTVAWNELQDDPAKYEGIEAGSADHANAAHHGSTPAKTVSFVTTQDGAGHSTAGADGQSQAAGTPDAPPEPNWVKEFPVEINAERMAVGKKRYEIYCGACHGLAGDGDGLVTQRATELSLQGKSAWIAPRSMHDPKVLEQPVGRIFNTITHGRGGMGPYASQITAEDRWAIVMYIKALQRTRMATAADLPTGAADLIQRVDQIGPAVAEPSKDGAPADGAKN
jgi:mono/diheme cytochrome c family protein